MGLFDSIFGQGVKAVSDIIGQFHMSPEDKAKLQESMATLEFNKEQLELTDRQKLEEIASTDRDSARKRQIAVKDLTPAVLAASVTCGFFGLLYLLAFRDVPGTSHDIVMTMIGSLGTAWISIIAYYFGSSSGSAKKNEMLDQIISKKE